MQVALYARVSTAEEKELQDPEVQLTLLRDYCRLNGHEVIETYVDRASGKSAEGRDQFKKMIQDAEAHRFEAVICLRLDRFMREAVEGMYYCKKLQDAGCQLILAKDPMLGCIDTSTDIGQLVLMVIFTIGKIERKNILLRSKEGIHHFKEKKGWWGRGCPNPKEGKKGKRTDINLDLAIELLKVRGSFSKVAKELGVPRSTLQDRFEVAGVDYRTYLTCRNRPPEKTPLPSYTLEGGTDPPEYARNPAGGNDADRETVEQAREIDDEENCSNGGGI